MSDSAHGIVKTVALMEIFLVPVGQNLYELYCEWTDDQKEKFDVTAQVQGGGVNGQAEACAHGIARAKLEPHWAPDPTPNRLGSTGPQPLQ